MEILNTVAIWLVVLGAIVLTYAVPSLSRVYETIIYPQVPEEDELEQQRRLRHDLRKFTTMFFVGILCIMFALFLVSVTNMPSRTFEPATEHSL